MPRTHLCASIAEWAIVLVLGGATLALSGCAQLISAIPEGGPIPKNLAEDYARLSSGASVAAVEVVSSQLSTYGIERPGGTAAAPDTKVWAVVLKGAFPYGSCSFPGLGMTFWSQSPALVPTVPPVPCPAPALRQRILLNARNGQFIERIIPA
jgi:hypothetical protein